MGFKYSLSIIVFVSILCGLFSCSNNEPLNVEPEFCDVALEGFSFVNPVVEEEGSEEEEEVEGGGLKTTVIERKDDTPDNVMGYKVSVENKTYSEAPLIEMEFEFDYFDYEYEDGIINNVLEGNNKFIAESVRNADLFENKPEVGSQFNNGWDVSNLILKPSGNRSSRIKKYREEIDDTYPCYTKYRSVVERHIYKNQDNIVPFEMQAVNGRSIVVIENNKRNYALDIYKGGERLNERIYRGDVLYVLFNTDSESIQELKLDIKFYEDKGYNWEYRKNNEQIFKVEPGKNMFHLVIVKN